MKIYGNKSLLEKFSESMPDWIKRGLEFEKKHHDELTFSVSKKVKPRVGGKEYTTDSSVDNLFNQLDEAGVDFNKVKIYTEEVPTDVKDINSIKQSGAIPIFGLKNGQLWFKGINDNEMFLIPDGRRRPFGTCTIKHILENCINFGYVYPDESVRSRRKLHNDRTQNRDGSIERGKGDNLDKSGYKNDRLGKNVDELKKEISNKIDDLEGRKERVAKAKADRESNKSTPQEVKQEVEKIEDEIEDLDEINAHLYKLDNNIEQMDELVFKAKRIILKNRKTYKSIMSRNKAKQYYTTEFDNVNEYIGKYHQLINEIEDVKALIPDSKGDDEFIIRKLDRITKSLEEFVDSFPVKEFSMTSGIQHLNRWGIDEGISVLG